MNTGKSLRVAMAKADISVNELAEKMGKKKQHISRLRVSTSMSKDCLEFMSKEFGIPVSEFIALGED